MPKRAPARSIGVYYRASTRKVTHVKIPDFEDELTNPDHIQPGERMLRLSMKEWGTPTRETLASFVSTVERLLR